MISPRIDTRYRRGRPAPGAAASTTELVLLEFDVQFLSALQQPLLQLADRLVVDQRADLLEKEAQQRAGGDVADALVSSSLK